MNHNLKKKKNISIIVRQNMAHAFYQLQNKFYRSAIFSHEINTGWSAECSKHYVGSKYMLLATVLLVTEI